MTFTSPPVSATSPSYSLAAGDELHGPVALDTLCQAVADFKIDRKTIDLFEKLLKNYYGRLD